MVECKKPHNTAQENEREECNLRLNLKRCERAAGMAVKLALKSAAKSTGMDANPYRYVYKITFVGSHRREPA